MFATIHHRGVGDRHASKGHIIEREHVDDYSAR
jgi:hypothetical protein